VISQNRPARKPDFAKMYGSPRIPAPIMVPLNVNVVAQNFLFMFCSPSLMMVLLFLRVFS